MTIYTAHIGRISHTFAAPSDAAAIAESVRVARDRRGHLDRMVKHDGHPPTDLPSEDVMFAFAMSSARAHAE